MKRLARATCLLSALALTGALTAATQDAPKAPKAPTAPAAPATPSTPAPPAPKMPAMPAAPAGNTAPVVTPVPDAPTPKAIWQKFIDACGGIDVIRGNGSRQTKGTIVIPGAGATGTVETFSKAPDRIVVKSTIPGIAEVQQAFNGTDGWAVDQMTGPRLLEGTELESFRRDAAYDGPFGYLEAAREASTLGSATFANTDCWVVELKEVFTSDLLCYFDRSTGLLKGLRMISETQMGKIPVEMIVAEYGTYGKCKFPSKNLTRMMTLEITSTVDSVTWDEIPDSTFEPPVAVKTLIQARKNPAQAPAGKKSTTSPTPPAKSAP